MEVPMGFHVKNGLVMEVFMCLFLSSFLVSALSDEGTALMDMKSSFTDAANALNEWDNIRNGNFCSWRGVSCDNSTLTVISLNLTSLNLGGKISPSIGDLRNLQSIDLRGNNITGQIPDEIGNCTSLTYLDLSENSLGGDLPFSISKLKKLELLNLKSNHLGGPIPSTLSQNKNLRILDLAGNQLTGEIQPVLYWNEVLEYLGLRGNMLTGALSPDICQLTSLWYFDVRGNNLAGTIPDSIGNCTSLQILDLSYNQITGEIPYNIGFLQVATLSLQGNQLTGQIPEVIGLMQALAVLDLSENMLVGPIPPVLGNLSYAGKLYLHGNNLSGPIPAELGNMSKLSYLQLNDNQLTGNIPPELGRLEQLFELNLANNNLEGPIPESFSSCTALNQLNVHGNRLTGIIPSTLKNLQSLTYLNLSSNNFRGRIPDQLGRIINLDTLDLSNNSFSGPVASSIGDLEHLLTLNLSRNNLSGSIPFQLGNLKSIETIDISFNDVTGTIPAELGRLQNIISLLLNNNNLRGSIPEQIENCLSLESLNVSYNNLSGNVPPMKALSRFSPDSFIGNPLLCGNWPGSICEPTGTKSRALLPKAAVVCMTLGLMVLLAMVTAAIYKTNHHMDIDADAEKSLQQGPLKMVVLHMDMAIHSIDDIMLNTENFNDKYVVGYGSSSTVFKCQLKNSRPLAIKRLYNQYPYNIREFETELETIGRIRHRNIVSLHGYALTPRGNLLFYDYMENGSLWDMLHGPSKKVKLDWEARLKIAVGVAQGLAYLHHDCNPRIIHRDVKSSNILLDENFEAHLSDFGIAKCINPAKTHASSFVLGTIGYIDPEYARTSRLNEKSDVYSFGIVLLELLTGKKAVENESNLQHLILSKADDNSVMEAVDPDVSVTCIDMTHIKKTFQLALLCTKRYPSDRPTMHEVARVLLSFCYSPSKLLSKPVNHAMLEIDKEQNHRRNPQENQAKDPQWFDRFREAISNNTL